MLHPECFHICVEFADEMRLYRDFIGQMTGPGPVTDLEHRAWLHPDPLTIGCRLRMNACSKYESKSVLEECVCVCAYVCVCVCVGVCVRMCGALLSTI